MVKYKLTYFDGMGRAEPIRLLLHYMDQPFEDFRFQMNQWPTIKKDLPWGKVPVLEVDGKSVCQSLSICRYLGKLAGLAGSDPWEDLQMDMLADCAEDIIPEMAKYWGEKNEERKNESREKFLSESLPYCLERFDKLVKENRGYLVNGKLSWVDFVVISHCWMYSADAGYQVTEDFPHLKSLQDKITNHPKLKDYIRNRPSTIF